MGAGLAWIAVNQVPRVSWYGKLRLSRQESGLASWPSTSVDTIFSGERAVVGVGPQFPCPSVECLASKCRQTV